MQFNFNEEYKLENDRVLLRPLQTLDREFYLPFSLNEPELWKYSLQGAGGEENLDKYLAQAFEGRAQQREYPFIVFDKKANGYAGCTRFYDIQPALSTMQLGYTWYGSAFHGTGLNKNCKYLLLGFAFEQLGAERVEFRADNDNKRSIAAMKSIGCQVEGILRSNMPKPEGGRRDSIVLSILKEEWHNTIKAKLELQLSAYR
ncbi:N-acetyltransferase [Segetibacter sp. 3557_3]|uniref:GNAT family N-acetyltransferase n=1 Tax=Segetibacter sp. 3557_3 TaxID=2547429 RepID=UPI001058464F|nr:GNAT family N-acetyltransferase [Segetibacter sp. 3557_3]TDH27977.1 N-acetyltransferase [Segetibacter sp. 3557_3]